MLATRSPGAGPIVSPSGGTLDPYCEASGLDPIYWVLSEGRYTGTTHVLLGGRSTGCWPSVRTTKQFSVKIECTHELEDMRTTGMVIFIVTYEPSLEFCEHTMKNRKGKEKEESYTYKSEALARQERAPIRSHEAVELWIDHHYQLVLVRVDVAQPIRRSVVGEKYIGIEASLRQEVSHEAPLPGMGRTTQKNVCGEVCLQQLDMKARIQDVGRTSCGTRELNTPRAVRTSKQDVIPYPPLSPTRCLHTTRESHDVRGLPRNIGGVAQICVHVFVELITQFVPLQCDAIGFYGRKWELRVEASQFVQFEDLLIGKCRNLCVVEADCCDPLHRSEVSIILEGKTCPSRELLGRSTWTGASTLASLRWRTRRSRTCSGGIARQHLRWVVPKVGRIQGSQRWEVSQSRCHDPLVPTLVDGNVVRTIITIGRRRKPPQQQQQQQQEQEQEQEQQQQQQQQQQQEQQRNPEVQ
ncbi:hypothetical protein B566_EDAN015565 [Ephemera danica]|nr:hypothetical protein B566_EDAN015565 [Ephemera danica]